jgi:hypothetical protein
MSAAVGLSYGIGAGAKGGMTMEYGASVNWSNAKSTLNDVMRALTQSSSSTSVANCGRIPNKRVRLYIWKSDFLVDD